MADTYNLRLKKFTVTDNYLTQWGIQGGPQEPENVAVDSDGNIYVAESGNNRILKFDAAGNLVTTWGSEGSGDGQFYRPYGIALDSQDNVYVVDRYNHRIQKFSSSGSFLAKWGTQGSGDGQFNNPMGIAVDAGGDVYVTDMYNHRVQKFDGDGILLTKWGSQGTDDGQFTYPKSVTVDAEGHVYVLNNGEGGAGPRIQKFTAEGAFLTKFGKQGAPERPAAVAIDGQGNTYVADDANSRILKFDAAGNLLTKWGGPGTAAGEFRYPYDVVLDSQGNVYVADYGNHRIQKFGSGGNFLLQWGSQGSGDGQFVNPNSLAVDSQGNIYVVEYGNHRLQKFDSAMNFLAKWGSEGSGDGQFSYPMGINADGQGNIYVVDTYNSRIQKFDGNGTLLTKWGSYGTGEGNLNYPRGVGIDSQGNVYVTDYNNRRVQKFDANGVFLGMRPGLLPGPGELNNPQAIAADRQNNIFVSDSGNSRIQKLDATGQFLAMWGSEGSGNGQFDWPQGIAVDSTGNVYVADSYNYRIQKFSPAAASTTVWQDNVPMSLGAGQTTNIPSTVGKLAAAGKFALQATLYNSLGQVIARSASAFFVTDRGFSIALETDKRVYKPGETVNITCEVKSRSDTPKDLTLSLKKDGAEIYTASFTLAPGNKYPFTTTITAEATFNLDAAIDGLSISDTLEVKNPSLEASLTAPDMVGLAPFDVGVMLRNTGEVTTDVTVTIGTESWNVSLPPGGARLLETTRSITANTTLQVLITGDVTQTLSKSVTMGESATIIIQPSPIYLEGPVEIPFTVNNTGSVETDFAVTFQLASTDVQTVTRSFRIPPGQSVTDTLGFTMSRGEHQLSYTSPFGEGSLTLFAGVPEFELQLPTNLTISLGQTVTWDFKVKNKGGIDGDVQLYLGMTDFEETKTTRVRAGAEETLSFTFVLPDDLEEKIYTAVYQLNETKGRLSFQVQGAKVSVGAALDKALYQAGETAQLTLTVTNQRDFAISLFSRVKFQDYDETQAFNLAGNAGTTLTFNVPLTALDKVEKVLYTVYLASGRALYINSIYLYPQPPAEAGVTIYTDKQVYNTGEKVTITAKPTRAGTLALAGPGLNWTGQVSGDTAIDFTLPDLRSGAYNIEYAFGEESGVYPIDVIGYYGRVIESDLNKSSFAAGDILTLTLNVEVNRQINGVLKVSLYDPELNLLEQLESQVLLQPGENQVKLERPLLTTIMLAGTA